MITLDVPALPVVVSDHIRHATSETDVVVLDLKHNRYSVLGAVAGFMWRSAQDHPSRDEVVDAVVATFDVDPGGAASDFDAFLADCAGRGWLGEKASALPHIAPRVVEPTTARAWKWLLRTSIDLRGMGVWGVHRHLERYRPVAASAQTARRVDAALRAFSAAENAFRLKHAPDDCLPRSFALAFFLRSAGLPAQHRIGVARYPFRAHAWVEIEGCPVGESLDVSPFVALSRLG